MSLLRSTFLMPPPSSLSSGSFMERKKSRSRGGVDELALAKSAAWAWFERGSGLERKPVREYDVMRACRALGPSRYKQEAVKFARPAKVQDERKKEKEKEKEKPLMDSYEVCTISRQLDRFLERGQIHGKGYHGSAKVRLHHDHQKYNSSSLESERSSGSKMQKKIKKKKKSSGFWQKNGLMCGTREDVVEASVFREARSRHKQPAPVVR